MLDELEDPVLSRALSRFRIEGHGTRRLIVNQRPFINIVSSLRATVGRDWSIMIVAPEDDFVGFVKENSRSATGKSGLPLNGKSPRHGRHGL